MCTRVNHCFSSFAIKYLAILLNVDSNSLGLGCLSSAFLTSSQRKLMELMLLGRNQTEWSGLRNNSQPSVSIRMTQRLVANVALGPGSGPHKFCFTCFREGQEKSRNYSVHFNLKIRWCQFCDFIIWFLSQFNCSVKRITASEVERVEYHCQKRERWVNSRYVMSRHGWSLRHVYLQPPKVSFWVNGDFSQDSLREQDLLLTKHSQMKPGEHPSLTGDEQNDPGLFSALCHTSCFLKQNPQRSGLTFLTSKEKWRWEKITSCFIQQGRGLTFETLWEFQQNLSQDRD